MPLKPGTRLGPYEILAQLGAGGMGEVYKGRDVRLERLVALKVLAPHLAANREARERFEREATTVAKLKHAHICLLYDIGTQELPGEEVAPPSRRPEEEPAGGRRYVRVDYLVFEYLEGETLSQRLANGPLPLDQVLQYSIEIADALDKAHRAGVTHRDIKPGNIMIVPSSETASKTETKLLDFGLAKLKQAALPADLADLPRNEWPTGAGAPTAQGTVLGTAQYMAPEQVEGKVNELDARTDIFSFGATVYEMATGKKAFEGKSQASIMAAILKEDPPAVSSLDPPGKLSSPALDRVVKKCLAKEPEERWQSAKDLHDELKWIKQGGEQVGKGAAIASSRRFFDRLGWVAASVIAVIASGFGFLYFRSTPSPGSNTIRFSISPTSEAAILGVSLAVSPDGTQVAFLAVEASTGNSLIWVRPLDSPTAHPLQGTQVNANNLPSLFWSPDSRSIGFITDGKLKTVPVSGGPVQVLADAFPRGGSWGRDGTILFTPSRQGGLARISATGGASSPVTNPDRSRGETSHRWPQFLPDGRHFLYFADTNQQETMALYVGSLDSQETRLVLRTEANAVYAAGYLFFLQGSALMAQPFDPDRLELSGQPSFVADGIWYSQGANLASFSVSERGVLAYASSGGSQNQLLWFDRSGSQVGTVETPEGSDRPELSPDGKSLAVQVLRGGESADIWFLDIVRGLSTRFTSDPRTDRYPLWSPDGSRILFHSDRGGLYDLYQKLSSGAGAEEVVFQDSQEKYPYDWSSDGSFLVYSPFGSGPDVTADLWILPLSGDRKPIPYLTTQFEETHARFSPDVRWLTFVSNESGRDEVYVSSFPTPGGKVRVSTNGGRQPRWREDGRELFYLTPDQKLMAVPVEPGSTLDVRTPTALFDIGFEPAGSGVPATGYDYDVAADGQRFLISRPGNATVPVTVVLNWTAGLRR